LPGAFGFILNTGTAEQAADHSHLARERPQALRRAKQVAEKGLGCREFEYWHLQGLKPDIDLIGLIGMTKVMPCYKALEVELWASFSATCKARAGYKAFAARLKSCPDTKRWGSQVGLSFFAPSVHSKQRTSDSIKIL